MTSSPKALNLFSRLGFKTKTNEPARVKMVLITWLRKTVLRPIVHSGVWGSGVQIGRCGYTDILTAEEQNMVRQEI